MSGTLGVICGGLIYIQGEIMQTLVYIIVGILTMWMIAMLIADQPGERRKRIEDEIAKNRVRRRWGRP